MTTTPTDGMERLRAEMDEAACLEAIRSGEGDAYDLLMDADPALKREFMRVDRALVNLLAKVKRHFPDAAFYTASGGFNLMLGRSHDDKETSQQQLIALSGEAHIGDGDF